MSEPENMPDTETVRPGLGNSVRKLASTLLAIGQTRLELLANDVEEERSWLSAMLIWTIVTLFCIAMAVMLATLFVVIYFWDSNRFLAIGIMIALFSLAAALSWNVARNMSRNKPRLFSASIAELAKDRKPLEPGEE